MVAPVVLDGDGDSYSRDGLWESAGSWHPSAVFHELDTVDDAADGQYFPTGSPVCRALQFLVFARPGRHRRHAGVTSGDRPHDASVFSLDLGGATRHFRDDQFSSGHLFPERSRLPETVAANGS